MDVSCNVIMDTRNNRVIQLEKVNEIISEFEADVRARIDKIESWLEPLHLYNEDEGVHSWQCLACENEFKTEDEAFGHIAYCKVREALKLELKRILGESSEARPLTEKNGAEGR